MTDKFFTGTTCKDFNDDDLSFVAYASKEVVDRDGEIIKAKAWELDEYKKNPVVLLSHDPKQLPVARAGWVKQAPDGLRFMPVFAKTAAGREVYELYKQGILNAFSVGFQPLEWEKGKDKVKRVYTKAKLLEISCVSIPSCPDALVERVVNGTIKTKELKDALKEIIPVNKPKAENTGYKTSAEKTTSLDGRPSIRDISNKIAIALGKSPDNDIYVYVIDMFPNTSTSGSCIVEFDSTINDTRSKYWQYDYDYNKESDVVTLINPIAVEEVFARKIMDRIEPKAGRELSARNVTALKGVSSKMKDASGMIDGMLAGKDLLTDTNKSIGTSDNQEEEKVQKDGTINSDDLKEVMASLTSDLMDNQILISEDDIREVMQTELKRALGVLD